MTSVLQFLIYILLSQKDTCALKKWIHTKFTDHLNFAWDKFQIFRHTVLSSYRKNFILNIECVILVLAEDCLLTCLHACLGIRNIIIFQSDDFCHYFKNNTWNTENLLHDYDAYSKCIPTGMAFCSLWNDISFVHRMFWKN